MATQHILVVPGRNFFFLWVLGMEREENFYFIHFMIFYFKKRWKEREKNSYICLKIIILKRNK